MQKYPFEASIEDLQEDTDQYVDVVFSTLESEFLVMPKGEGFVAFPVFERGYAALKSATAGFTILEGERILATILKDPISLVVLRAIMGLSPPEWAYMATQETGANVTQGFVRSLDRRVRLSPDTPLKLKRAAQDRLEALIETACRALAGGAPDKGPDQLHRFDKVDTRSGAESMQKVAEAGVPYAVLLHERFLGRPFAGHRDSVSELVGNSLEDAIEHTLTDAGVSFHKPGRAERIEGFDQSPDFVVPDESNPQVIIEAKVTEDDGTARDKVTRIQHLSELSLIGRKPTDPKYEVIACIAGRGFGVRREDMKKLILCTRGKVFTMKTLDLMVEHTRLRSFKIR
jgi:hypothetical protein